MDINIKLWFRQQGITLFGIFVHAGRGVASWNWCYRTDPALRAAYGRFFVVTLLYLTKKGGI